VNVTRVQILILGSGGRRYRNSEEVEKFSREWQPKQQPDLYGNRIFKIVPRQLKSITVLGTMLKKIDMSPTCFHYYPSR